MFEKVGDLAVRLASGAQGVETSNQALRQRPARHAHAQRGACESGRVDCEPGGELLELAEERVVGDLGLQHGEGVLKEEEGLPLTVTAEQEERETHFGLGDHVMVARAVNVFVDGKGLEESGFALIKEALRLKAAGEADVADSDVGMHLGAEDLLVDEESALQEGASRR
jgi:hypothetical protein